MPWDPVSKLILLNSVLAGPVNSAQDPQKRNANTNARAVYAIQTQL